MARQLSIGWTGSGRIVAQRSLVQLDAYLVSLVFGRVFLLLWNIGKKIGPEEEYKKKTVMKVI